jgi:hypothetical protein
LRFSERMLTFECSRYAPPPAPDLSISERCPLVILTVNNRVFRCLGTQDIEERY